VVADGDRVTLRGMVRDEAERKAASEVAHRVPGVKHVHSELRTFTRPRR
jgi:osmotically-inducible protein OsmY